MESEYGRPYKYGEREEFLDPGICGQPITLAVAELDADGIGIEKIAPHRPPPHRHSANYCSCVKKGTDHMETYVYKKEVDWSLFNYGFAIPIEYQVVFKKIADRFITLGESKLIRIFLDGKLYEASLNNYKHGTRTDIVQVRYNQNSDIAGALRNAFQRSYEYILSKKKLQEPGSKKKIPLPDEYKEYLAVYTTEYDDTYVLETIVSDEVNDLKQTISGKEERLIEAEIDYDEIDASAGIQTSKMLMKIRKLNRLIGTNLKLLYGYRCQICGKVIGEEYGSHIAEAHHIDYFVNSLNNDSSNQMVVCPNHHSIIHDANPVFDRARRLYVYANGLEQGLALNLHL